MINIDKLFFSISENSIVMSGVGDAYIIPNMTLTEVFAYLPVVMMEDISDLSEYMVNTDELIIESSLDSSFDNMIILIEGSMESVNNKIHSFIDKAIGFMRNIIQRIKDFFLSLKNKIANWKKSNIDSIEKLKSMSDADLKDLVDTKEHKTEAKALPSSSTGTSHSMTSDNINKTFKLFPRKIFYSDTLDALYETFSTNIPIIRETFDEFNNVVDIFGNKQDVSDVKIDSTQFEHFRSLKKQNYESADVHKELVVKIFSKKIHSIGQVSDPDDFYKKYEEVLQPKEVKYGDITSSMIDEMVTHLLENDKGKNVYENILTGSFNNAIDECIKFKKHVEEISQRWKRYTSEYNKLVASYISAYNAALNTVIRDVQFDISFLNRVSSMSITTYRKATAEYVATLNRLINILKFRDRDALHVDALRRGTK